MSDFASRKVGTDEDEALYRAGLSFSILVIPHFSETTLTQCKDSSFKPPAHYIPICFTDETLGGGRGGLNDEERQKRNGDDAHISMWSCSSHSGNVTILGLILKKKKHVCEE